MSGNEYVIERQVPTEIKMSTKSALMLAVSLTFATVNIAYAQCRWCGPLTGAANAGIQALQEDANLQAQKELMQQQYDLDMAKMREQYRLEAEAREAAGKPANTSNNQNAYSPPPRYDREADAVERYRQGWFAYNQGNFAEALQFFGKAAEQGHANAQNNLGVMYANGRGVSQDEAEAVKWYSQSAAQGNALAQSNLADMYFNGRGVSKDDKEAVVWYKKAADQGNSVAQFNLGVMYANGFGIAKNDTEAVKWYRKAAENSISNAQAGIGIMYQYGRGIAKDEEEAVKWYRRAAEQGMPWLKIISPTCTSMATVSPRMTLKL